MRRKGSSRPWFNAAAKAKITVQPIRRNISVLEGSGGNIAVLTGRDGKLLVDAGFAVSRPAISDALTSINPDPIKHLINTHWHTDHTDGNEWLHSAGAAITAHENTRKRLAVDTRVEGWDYTFPAVAKGALPTTVFATDHEMRRNDTRIVLKYYSPAHTDSDISVLFSEADVIHVGDTWWNGVYPFIDYSTGGSIDGQIRAAEANLAKVTAGMIAIPGHGPVGGRAELIEFRDMLVDDPRERGRTQETGTFSAGHHRGETHRRLRREMGKLSDHARGLHGPGLHGRLADFNRTRKTYADNHDKRWYRDLLQGLGKRAAARLQPWMAAYGGRLGRPDDLPGGSRIPLHRA